MTGWPQAFHPIPLSGCLHMMFYSCLTHIYRYWSDSNWITKKHFTLHPCICSRRMATSASSLHPAASPMQSRSVSTCCVNILSLPKLHVRPGYYMYDRTKSSSGRGKWRAQPPSVRPWYPPQTIFHLWGFIYQIIPKWHQIPCESGKNQLLALYREGNTSALLSSQPLSVSNSSLDTTCSTDTPQVEKLFLWVIWSLIKHFPGNANIR